MIASAAADISSSSGNRTQIADVPLPSVPSSSKKGRPAAIRSSSRLRMVSSKLFMCGRGGHSSGGGTSGRMAHCPTSGSGRSPSAPSTVSISVSPTCAITRAWLIRCPRTTSVASSSSTDGGDAYERYCAVAHTHGRPVTCSITSIAAPRPQPPNSAPAPGRQPGHDRHPPLVRLVRSLEPEERQRIHRRRTLPDRRRAPPSRTVRDFAHRVRWATHASSCRRGYGTRAVPRAMSQPYQ